jgi:probable F420-dependent oxidoreductase
MQYGFTIPGRGPLGIPDSMVALAQRGEALGFDSISLGDHILVPKSIQSDYPYTPNGEFPGASNPQAMEQITTLAYLAGCTEKIRLATSVLIVPHRNPLVAAKALATLDYLSGGRLIIGVGVGWMREEFDAIGCEPFDERGAVTDEYIRAFKELWTSDNPTFEGKYVSFSDIHFQPKPVQKPHPPLWVGGESRPAIRRAATLCDGWYPIGNNPAFPVGTPEALQASIGRLRSTAERAGRNPDEIQIIYRTNDYRMTGTDTSSDRIPFTGNSEQIAGDIHQYEDMGVSHMVLDLAWITAGGNLEESLGHLEDFATQVAAKV